MTTLREHGVRVATDQIEALDDIRDLVDEILHAGRVFEYEMRRSRLQRSSTIRRDTLRLMHGRARMILVKLEREMNLPTLV